MGVMDEAELVEPADAGEWADWLREHHTQDRGVWLVNRRSAAEQRFTYEDSILAALRWGWVDSTSRVLDDERTMLWFAPRRRGSIWTRNNKERVARLEEAGLLEPAGAAAVAAAKESGMWTLMDDVEDRVVPDDLAAAFDRHPGAREQWEAFSPSAQKQALAWVVMAKRSETRAARVETVAAKAARGERVQ